MTYLHGLLLTSIGFLIVERLRPWRPQRLLRSGLLRDVGFLALNGHGFAVLTGGLEAALVTSIVAAARDAGLVLGRSPLGTWPLYVQVPLLLVVSDFLQWCIHRLLHGVPWLWQIHKVHHSIAEMDWIGNWHFHWGEILVYRWLQWVPLAWLGASPQAALIVAVIGTVWGNLNHSNLDWDAGPLSRLFNSPRMHLWHHDASDEGGLAKNFGVILSAWDFLFGTAYWPRDRSPERLGYPGDMEMPRGLVGQLAWPLARAPRTSAS